VLSVFLWGATWLQRRAGQLARRVIWLQLSIFLDGNSNPDFTLPLFSPISVLTRYPLCYRVTGWNGKKRVPEGTPSKSNHSRIDC
jgi:hypothetical protein